MRKQQPAPAKSGPTARDSDTSSQTQPQVDANARQRRQARLPHERDESATATGNRMNEPEPPSSRLIKAAGKNVDEGQLDTDRRGIPNDVPSVRGSGTKFADPHTSIPTIHEGKGMAAKKRTTHRSGTGAKLYAERSKSGEFEDVQRFKKAHGQDVKRVSKAETTARKKAGQPARKKRQVMAK